MRRTSNTYLRILVGLAVAVALAISSKSAWAFTVEKGRAEVIPWSGYWWPIRKGRILQPLSKYDQITGKQSAAWEKQKRPPGPEVPHWFGYCHAWASSSVMEFEPRQIQSAQTQRGQQLKLGVGDQKGLLAVCHFRDAANSHGDRFGDGIGSEDKQDLAPDVLWRLLKLYLQQNGVPLILDVEAGPEVWNYPVYAYEIRYAPQGNSGLQYARLTLWMADDAVPPDYRGVKTRRQTYNFTFQLRGSSVVMGSGRWVGRNQDDHPDFAWYPYLAVAENPEVEYDTVQQLVSSSPRPNVGRPDQPTDPTPVEPTPVEPAPVEPPRPETPPVEQPERPNTTPETDTPVAISPSPQPDAIVISPMELVALIAEKTSSFEFDATVDRFDGATYHMGEKFFVRFSTGKPGYLYLIQIDPKGAPSLLYPTRGENNRIAPGQPMTIPSADPKAGFPVTGPVGTTRIKALVTSRPLEFSGALIGLQQQQEPKPGEKGSRAIYPVPFRWHPTQRQQVQQLLSQQQGELTTQAAETDDPKALLGPFAQDEVAFYVDRPKVEQKQRPAGSQQQRLQQAPRQSLQKTPQKQRPRQMPLQQVQ